MSRSRLPLLLPLIAPLAALAVAVSVLGAGGEPSELPRLTRNPAYQTQQRPSPGAVRAAQVERVNAENEDIGLETCSAHGVRPLAARFGVPAEADAVARAFALQWDPAYRPGAYEGCLKGLREAGASG